MITITCITTDMYAAILYCHT